jgi:hypothetical protein
MTWELYEVWSVDEDGHEDLVDTTRSLKEAQEIASATLEEEHINQTVIYRETEDGDLEELSRITK